jgi:N,N'-diacetyllegionaminate synthase
MKNTKKIFKTKLIAEIGWNHMGSISLAKKMIISAKKSGADFCKFQSWSEGGLKQGAWDIDGRREIYKKAQLNLEKHRILKNFCEKNNIVFFSSAFNLAGAKLLKKINTPIIKIPSHEVNNLELIKYCLKNFKSVLISLGACTRSEIIKISKLRYFKSRAKLLHCVSSYPLKEENVNIPKFRFLQMKYKNVGYSGHLGTIDDAIAAITLGATYVEKHFTINKKLPGRDNKFALLPDEFKKISDYRNNFFLMSKNKGLNLQACERDIYKNYRGRWGNEKTI